jgi:hypothetical protein
MKSYYKPVLLLLFISIMISCTGRKNGHEVEVKYREKTPVEILKVDSTIGNIEITGWSNDFIEINTRKILNTGLVQDMNLMDTIFEKNDNQMNIKTKIPARVDGKINLKIFIPFILYKLYINSKDGNISISNYLGDVELTNNNGNINVDFQGNILRVDSKKSKLNINVNSFNSTDIVINNEEAPVNVSIESVGKSSYLDIKSVRGDINFTISRDIDHRMMITNKNRKINLKYNLYDKTSTEGTYSYITGKKGSKYNDFTIDISDEDAKINISSADSGYFIKEKSRLKSVPDKTGSIQDEVEEQ